MKPFLFIISLTYLMFSQITFAIETKNAVVISGGISLGVYEAGLNHVLVEVTNSKNSDIKLPKLQVATGSSAGAINAIATALSTCLKPTEDEGRLFNNIFRDIWIGVGMDELMPVDYGNYGELSIGGILPADKEHKISDSLFSRKVFETAIGELRKMVKREVNEDCHVLIGIMVTLAKPNQVLLTLNNGVNTTINKQSYAIPIRVTVKSNEKGDKRIVFQPVSKDEIVNTNQNYLNRNFINLPSFDGEISLDSVIRAGLASSAFPGAFGPITLDYCDVDNLTQLDTQVSNKYCTDQETFKTGVFIDGGYFNNIPIGFAAELMTTFTKNKETKLQENYIFIDPDNTNSNSTNESNPIKTGLTLKTQLGNVLPGIGTLRKRDLYNDLFTYFQVPDKSNRNVPDKRKRNYNPTVRSPYLTGNFLGAFGAFFDPSFREYDYIAGVYDGMRFIARQLCDKEKIGMQDKCEVDNFTKVLDEMVSGVSPYEKKLSDFHALIGAFLCDDVETLSNDCNASDGPWSELIGTYYNMDYVSNTYLVYKALRKNDGGDFDSFLSVYLSEFEEYKALAENKNLPITVNISKQLNYMIYRQDFWVNLLLKRATQRLIYLERINKGDSLRLLTGAYILTPRDSLASLEIGNTEPSDQSSLLYSIIPDQFGIDAIQTGIVAGWSIEPKFRTLGTFNGNFEFGGSLHMQIKDQPEGRVNYANIWAGIRFHRPSTFLSSYGLSATVNRNISNTTRFGDDFMLGAQFNVGFLADKLRLTIGTRDAINNYGGEDWSVQLTFTNIDELIWAFK